jgi:hypothetical protein
MADIWLFWIYKNGNFTYFHYYSSLIILFPLCKMQVKQYEAAVGIREGFGQLSSVVELRLWDPGRA